MSRLDVLHVLSLTVLYCIVRCCIVSYVGGFVSFFFFCTVFIFNVLKTLDTSSACWVILVWLWKGSVDGLGGPGLHVWGLGCGWCVC